MLKVHILTDDIVLKRELIAEHGLSLWIEKDEKSILFDTGQTGVYLHNAKVMGIDITQTDYIILSHGHYDHCGGLVEFDLDVPSQNIYVNPDALISKYAISCENNVSREIGIPWSIEQLSHLKEKFIFNRKPLRIDEGIMLSGEIPSTSESINIANNFFIKKDNQYSHDLFSDEQMLIVDDDGKLTVFLGCSHRGVINSLNYVFELFPGRQIYALIAGMHLHSSSPEHIQMIIQKILDLNIQKVIPLHCTGFNATCEMKRSLGDRCLICTTGDTIEL